MLLGSLLERNEILNSHREALVCGDRRVTFAEHAKRVRRLASGLRALGARKQDRIAVLAMNCVEYVEIYGACERSSLIVVPVNFRLADPEILHVLSDSVPAVLIFEAQYAPVLERLRLQLASNLKLVCIGSAAGFALSYEEVIAGGDPASDAIQVLPNDGLSLFYTSGTTGRPKGVLRTQAAEASIAERMASDLDTSAEGRMLITMPLFHVGARGMQMAQHWMGGACIIHSAFDPLKILRTIETARITHVHMAPAMFQAFMDLPEAQGADLSSVRTLSYGAAPMPVPLLRRGIERLGRVFVNLYGATEGHVSCLRKDQHRLDGNAQDTQRLASVGQPSLGAEVRIVDDEGRDCPEGTPGEIILRAPWTMSGYWNNSVASLESVRDGWLYLGDIGYVDAEKFLYLVDRKKDMIISGGENIYSREVECALLEHPDVVDAAVIGVPDSRWGESVRAIVVIKQSALPDEQALIEHCRRLLARYKCPKSVMFVPELPRLPSGKVAKVELRKRFATSEPPGVSH
jgi:acyl-CoA synthetase (AMP-forming)/AMP-acid ligase II